MPTNSDPVSPINILAGVTLYFRNATNAPIKAKAMIAKTICSVIKNQNPNVNEINIPTLALSPLIPSIRLIELMMTKIVNIDNTILTQ